MAKVILITSVTLLLAALYGAFFTTAGSVIDQHKYLLALLGLIGFIGGLVYSKRIFSPMRIACAVLGVTFSFIAVSEFVTPISGTLANTHAVPLLALGVVLLGITLARKGTV